MNSGPSGFGSAPVTKVLVLATAGTSVLLQLTLSARKGQAGTLIVSTAQLLVFRHLGELAFGTILLYYFRIFERQRGSERYSSLMHTYNAVMTSSAEHQVTDELQSPFLAGCSGKLDLSTYGEKRH